MAGSETIAGRVIEFDKVYALCYTGGKRELPEKDQKEYNRILTLPFHLQAVEKHRQKLWENPEKDPNVVPLKGIQLLGFIKELHFVPIFDAYFEHTRRVFLTSRLDYELIKARSEQTKREVR
jgi:hypothetical protein